MIEAQGGDPKVVDDPQARPAERARRHARSRPSATGYLAAVDAEALGRASGELGAGRKKKGDPIDPAVGIVFRPKVGDRLEAGAGARHRARAERGRCARRASARSGGRSTVGDEPVEPPPLVYGWYGE